jgi:hypothetical protein
MKLQATRLTNGNLAYVLTRATFRHALKESVRPNVDNPQLVIQKTKGCDVRKPTHASSSLFAGPLAYSRAGSHDECYCVSSIRPKHDNNHNHSHDQRTVHVPRRDYRPHVDRDYLHLRRGFGHNNFGFYPEYLRTGCAIQRDVRCNQRARL